AEFNRPLILYCILAAMGVLVLIFLGIYMFTKDPERLKFAQSNLQTIISFMIGVAAGMLGTTGHT
ncbi:hypothetical protein, partial [Mesorhizobium sp.]|uniref:hypothetical protein n=1 Tax=Mesorhizobium sp. TaxID=1871066 RepID=UPI0025BB7958